jgi:hypothetical protein
LNKLILKVTETKDAEAGYALQKLANQYDYDALTKLLDEAAASDRAGAGEQLA